MKPNNRCSDNFMTKLLSIVLPIAFQQFMLALVSAIDALMLGKLTQDSLSAVSLASQVVFVESLILTAMTIGLSIFAAQYWGKNDVAAVERIFAYVMKITASVSMLFFAAAFFVPRLLMRIFTNEPVLIDGGAVYLHTVSLSFVLSGVSQIYLCILKNTGRAAKASLISSCGVIINILLNALLIFGLLGLPRLGIAGAALATVITQIIETLWCVFETLKKNSVKLRLSCLLHDDKRLRGDFWKYTTPVLGNEIVWGVGFTMYSVILGHFGTDAVAANSISGIVKNLASCFCIGLGSGAGIIVGNELGAGNPERAKEYGNRLCRLSVISGAASGAVLLIISPLIFAMTDLSDTANHYLKYMIVMCACYMVGKSVNSMTIGGIFCAGGDSKFGFLCDTVTMWCITVPLGMFAAFVMKLPVPAVYLIVNFDEMIKLPAVYRHYKKYKWVKNLTVKGEMQNE